MYDQFVRVLGIRTNNTCISEEYKLLSVKMEYLSVALFVMKTNVVYVLSVHILQQSITLSLGEHRIFSFLVFI